MNIHKISSESLSIEKIREIMENNYKLELSESATLAVQKCRDYLDYNRFLMVVLVFRLLRFSV